MWARTLFLVLVAVNESFSASVNLYLTNIALVSKRSFYSCANNGPNSMVTCGVLRGKNTTLSGTWVVDGSEGNLALTSLKVSLRWSDWKGDTLDKTVCQITGGDFQFVDKPCSRMEVPSGNYPLVPFQFEMIKPSSRSSKILTVSADACWNNDCYKNLTVAEVKAIIL